MFAHHRLSVLIIGVCFLLSACVNPPTKGSAADRRSRERAIITARKEISNRHWSLPADYQVKVERGTFIPEFVDEYDVYTVTFTAREPKKNSVRPLYEVDVDCGSEKVTGAWDQRKNVRDEEIAVARRAFERRFGLRRNQYILFASPDTNTITVRFSFDKVPHQPGAVTPQRDVRCVVDRTTQKVKSLEEIHN